MASAVASLAVAAGLQAVDGVALKAMVDAWSAASKPQTGELFHATVAVRQIEIGLASVTSLLFGLTVSLFGIAFWIDRDFPKWLAIPAVAGGVATAVSGVVIAHTGFLSWQWHARNLFAAAMDDRSWQLYLEHPTRGAQDFH
jgi:hypothetical protein